MTSFPTDRPTVSNTAPWRQCRESQKACGFAALTPSSQPCWRSHLTCSLPVRAAGFGRKQLPCCCRQRGVRGGGGAGLPSSWRSASACSLVPLGSSSIRRRNDMRSSSSLQQAASALFCTWVRHRDSEGDIQQLQLTAGRLGVVLYLSETQRQRGRHTAAPAYSRPPRRCSVPEWDTETVRETHSSSSLQQAASALFCTWVRHRDSEGDTQQLQLTAGRLGIVLYLSETQRQWGRHTAAPAYSRPPRRCSVPEWDTETARETHSSSSLQQAASALFCTWVRHRDSEGDTQQLQLTAGRLGAVLCLSETQRQAARHKPWVHIQRSSEGRPCHPRHTYTGSEAQAWTNRHRHTASTCSAILKSWSTTEFTVDWGVCMCVGTHLHDGPLVRRARALHQLHGVLRPLEHRRLHMHVMTQLLDPQVQGWQRGRAGRLWGDRGTQWHGDRGTRRQRGRAGRLWGGNGDTWIAGRSPAALRGQTDTVTGGHGDRGKQWQGQWQGQWERDSDRGTGGQRDGARRLWGDRGTRWQGGHDDRRTDGQRDTATEGHGDTWRAWRLCGPDGHSDRGTRWQTDMLIHGWTRWQDTMTEGHSDTRTRQHRRHDEIWTASRPRWCTHRSHICGARGACGACGTCGVATVGVDVGALLLWRA